MKKRKRIITFMVAIFICICSFRCNDSLAGVKTLGWDLVDSGKHLDWDGNTKYMSYFGYAVGVWNKYKRGVIRKDNIFRLQDVEISDFGEISSIAGITSKRKYIMFNEYTMDTLPGYMKRNVCIHELGHALGLGHNTSRDVMYKYVTSRVVLSTNDKRSYDYVYKYRY